MAHSEQVNDVHKTNTDNDKNITMRSITSTSASDNKSTKGGDSIASFSTDEVFSEVRLTLLLVSGKRHTFKFEPSDTVATVKKHVFENWPNEWDDETPSSASSLKIVYLGRFLDEGTTLESNKIHAGQTIIAHLTIKNVSPSDENDPKTTDTAKCQCSIL